MQRRWLLIGLGSMLIMAAIFLIMWVGSLQASIDELPLTGNMDCQVLNIKISSEDSLNTSWSNDLMYSELPSRFYLKATDNSDPNVVCSYIRLAGYFQRCSLDDPDNCTPFATVDPLGPFRTDGRGIARIDNYFLKMEPGRYQFTFKPSLVIAPWSNKINIKIDPSLSLAKPFNEVNMADYFINRIGYSYLYNSFNYLSPTELLGVPIKDSVVYTVENDLLWGGFMVRPWRVIKPETDTSRLMFASPDNENDSYYWSLGTKNYLTGTDNFDRVVAFASTNEIPPHFLVKRKSNVPGVIFNEDSEVKYTSLDVNFLPLLMTEDQPELTRMVRIEKIDKPLLVGKILYDDVIRLDQYEGPADLIKGNISYRESWYLAKGVGLIKISAKYFDTSLFKNIRPGDYSYIFDCVNDSDCLADEISAPHFRLELDKYQIPARLSVTISKFKTGNECGEDCDVNIVATEYDGFYIKLKDSTYTGFLDAQRTDMSVTRAFYVKDGTAFIKLSNLPLTMTGGFHLRFRTWVPNEIYPGEQRIKLDSLWSNWVKLSIVP